MFAIEALEGAGFAVDEAATASEALGRIRKAQGSYAAAIIDAALPEMPDFALASELRAMHADLPILIAVNGQAGDLRAALPDIRISSIISKPYDASVLLSALGALGVRTRRTVD